MSTHFHVSGTGVTGPLAGLSSNYKWWVLVTAIFGAFVSILDTTIVNTALPHIQRAFALTCMWPPTSPPPIPLLKASSLRLPASSPIALASNACICFPSRCSHLAQSCVASPGIARSSSSFVSCKEQGELRSFRCPSRSSLERFPRNNAVLPMASLAFLSWLPLLLAR